MRISDWSSDVCSSDLPTGQISRHKWQAKIKQHGLGDGPEADVDDAALKPEQRRQDREEEPGVNAEEGDLEYRIEGDQTGQILIVTPGELVQHQHHRDAPRERSEERRVRKECASKCRARGAP